MLSVCLWDANERLATVTMMDKARTVTDTETLQGDDPDKRNPYSASISLNHSHFRVLSAFAVLTFYFCLDSKNNINRMFLSVSLLDITKDGFML